jgi:CDGSH-type Zn-finger protein
MVIKTSSPLAIKVEAGTKYSTKTLYFCGSSGTQTPPYCDGSNNCGEI